MRQSHSRVLLAALVTAMIACGDDSRPAASISPVTGNSQLGPAGAMLEPLEVRVASSDGQPVARARVLWAVTQGSGSVGEGITVTDARGVAQTTVRLGTSAGKLVVVAAVSGTSLSTNFSETTTAASSAGCSVLTALSPAEGSVALSVLGSSLCLSGGASGADYALVTFNGSTNPNAFAAVTVTGTGVKALSTANRIPAALVPVRLAGALELAAASRYAAHDRVEARLRAAESRILPPYVAGARAWMSSGRSGALRDAIPATTHVGDLLRLNGNTDEPCDDPIIRIGRVAAISTNAIVVADTANPSGGFTDADYQSFAASFDTLVTPLDTTNFGSPTDIDHNGREVIFFTRAVDELTQPNSGEVIAGFFIPRDLYPQTSTRTFKACAGSNVGEMFYMQVPDPRGVVNGNPESVSEVRQFTVATLAHEFQHLINASRRLYVNKTRDAQEDTFLNEGLSHIAEELLFYRESGLSPLQNIDVTALRQNSATVNDFNSAQLANQIRYMGYLGSPSSTSPYSDDAGLDDRGAIWGFLRWAADHKGGSQTATWRALVNSKTIGLANLQGVFGADLMQQFRDYTTSLFADDLPGVSEPRAVEPSWNMRTITAALAASGEPDYPLAVVPLDSGSPAQVSLVGGGAAYVRFTVPAGGAAAITWTTAAAGINAALVRSR